MDVPPSQTHSSDPHTLHLYPAERAAAQPLCWSEAENNCAPQTQLCAFTDSHCVAGSNTCTYFSMASLASTTRSLSAHMSCVLLQTESGNQGAQERELGMWTLSCGCSKHQVILKVCEAASCREEHVNIQRKYKMCCEPQLLRSPRKADVSFQASEVRWLKVCEVKLTNHKVYFLEWESNISHFLLLNHPAIVGRSFLH